MSHGGKGSVPRPVEVSRAQFNSNWDTIFAKKPLITQTVDTSKTSETSEFPLSDEKTQA